MMRSVALWVLLVGVPVVGGAQAVEAPVAAEQQSSASVPAQEKAGDDGASSSGEQSPAATAPPAPATSPAAAGSPTPAGSPARKKGHPGWKFVGYVVYVGLIVLAGMGGAYHD